MYNDVVEKSPWLLEHVLDQFLTEAMCDEAVQRVSCMLEHVPGQYKTQEMCNEAVQRIVPDQYKTQEMCNEVVEKSYWMLELVPDQFVTQKMCNEAVKKSPCDLSWYKGYEQRNAQKAKIKEELMPVAWHPDRWWNWCVPEHEKKELEIYFA